MLFLLQFSNISLAQREANIWYFGTYAGVDFNTGTAIPLTDGQINRWEGVASFCDTLGNLMLYTDGDSVWNANHEPMENGYDLLGDPSSTESAIIIPYPLHDSLFFLFTVDEEGGDDGLCYSIVNMNKNNGLGAIETKNIPLFTPVVEKLTAVRHENSEDFWVITHGWETDSFFVYHVTPTGINTTPLIFEVGATHADIGVHGNNAVGYLRISPDGTRLASALQVNRVFELFDFNTQTGEISNPITIPDPGESPYGVEFSANAEKLYMTSRFYLYQADITYSNTADIINSIEMIDSSLTENFFGAIQLATDGKIYLAQEYSDYLGVINNPSETGENCDFELYGLYLEGRQSRLGLPDFIQTFFLPPDFKYNNFCYGDSTLFYLENTVGIDSVVWDFGDPSSSDNTSKKFSPKHKFSSFGVFSVKLTIWKNNIDFLKKQIININPLPEIFLGNDTLICLGDSILLTATAEDCSYLWNDYSTDSILWINNQGSYFVNLTNKYTNCHNSDTILLNISPLPDFSIGCDTGFCKFDSVFLHVEYENALFLWNTGNTDSTIFVSEAGTYFLQITDSITCKNSDTIVITEYELPYFSLGNDTIICPETQIILQPNLTGTFLWANETSFDYFVINQIGNYWLQFTDSNFCSFTDTISIFQKDFPVVTLINDTLICNGEILRINASPPNCTYSWSDGSNNNFLDVTERGFYSLFSTNICGTNIDSVYVDYEYCGEVDIPNIFTPNNDGINETFFIKGIKHEIWELLIYNRWGELVYFSKDYQSNWTGDENTNGTYYYILQNSENEQIFSGFVRIYR